MQLSLKEPDMEIKRGATAITLAGSIALAIAAIAPGFTDAQPSTVGVRNIAAVDAHPAGLKVLTENICGAKCMHGDDGSVDKLFSQIVKRQPDIITMNETCHSQFSHLVDKLNRKWPNRYDGNFGRAEGSWQHIFGSPSCNGFGHDSDIGNAILV